MRLRYSPRAVADLEATADYLTPISPQGAKKVRVAILKTLENLVLFPRMGRLQTVETVRKVVVRRYPYLVYYTLDEDAEEITILAIQHAAREREFIDA